MTREAGLGDEPHRVLDELSKISLVDVVMSMREKSVEICRHWVARPTEY